ncbi:MAG: hypothetical protein WD708_11825 [Kiritimatiellia bacterium]
MKHKGRIQRPKTLAEVADFSDSLEAFGRNLRDWQHEIQRGEVRNRPEFSKRLAARPRLLVARFPDGDIADATLAAYAEWLADEAGIDRPDWCGEPERVAENPWFGSLLRGWLIANTPASYRHRNLFTIPEPVFRPKPGRPRVPLEQKRRKAIARQKAYRERVRMLLQQARSESVRASSGTPN